MSEERNIFILTTMPYVEQVVSKRSYSWQKINSEKLKIKFY